MIDRRGIDANRALNEVLAILEQSLPMYLRFAPPWVGNGEQRTRLAWESVVADRETAIAKLSALLDSRRHTIDHGEFPMDFTSLHDLSLDFLVQQLIEHERRDVDAIATRLSRLSSDPEGQALAGEILVNARHHLESLESSRSAKSPNGAAG